MRWISTLPAPAEMPVARHPRGLERRLHAGDRGFQSVAIDVDHRLEHAGEAVVGAVLAAARTADRKLGVAETPPDPVELTLARRGGRRASRVMKAGVSTTPSGTGMPAARIRARR